MAKWINQAGTWIAPKPVKPNIWRTRKGGFLIRARPTNPRTGKKVSIRRVLHCSLEEAAATLQQEILTVRSGKPPSRSDAAHQPRFGEYALTLAEHKIAVGEHRSAATERRWRMTLRNHLLPAFGDFYIDQIRRADVLDYHASLARRIASGQMKPQTARGIFNNLKCVLRTYVREHDIERDPTNLIRGFDTSLHRTYTRENPNALLPAELPSFLAMARQMFPHHFAMLALGFSLGLRTCSLRPLRRKGPNADIDLDAGIIQNRRSHTEGQRVMERTKTGLDQEIPLPPELVAIVREHIANLPPGPMQKSDLLFPGPDGRIQSRYRLWMVMRKVAAAIGLSKRFTPHGMRRTNKDLLRVTGASQVVAMAISGHLTETMHNHYSTVGEAEQRESLGKVVSLMNLAAIISPASGGEESGEDRPSGIDPASNLRRENIQPSQISTTPVRHLPGVILEQFLIPAPRPPHASSIVATAPGNVLKYIARPSYRSCR